METRNIAIMLTDIKGFTSKTAGYSRAQTQELLTRHRELVMPVIEKFRGRLVKTIGDAFLVVFDSPTDAVICGVQVQHALKAHNADKAPADKIEIRIAINSGEVAIHDDGDIYGDAVNITSRLESIAEAGEVFFTEAVYLAMNKKEVPSSEIGYRQFKGIPEKIKVFRVLREVPVGALGAEPVHEAPAPAIHEPAPAGPSPKSAARRRRFLSLLVDMLVLALAVKALGLAAGGPRVRLKNPAKAVAGDMKVQNVTFDKGGLTVTGKDGERISISGEGGIDIRDRSGKAVGAEPRGGNWRAEEDADGALSKFLKALLWVIYCGVMMWRFGGTAGMRIMRLKALDASTGRALGADKAFLRAAFSLVSFAPAGLGFLWALWEKDGLTWHDLISGSRISDA